MHDPPQSRRKIVPQIRLTRQVPDLPCQTGGVIASRCSLSAFWQPTSACMACMPGSLGNIWSYTHWTIALHTGLVTGILAVLLTFTPAATLYGNQYGNALLVGMLTAVGDAYSHKGYYGTKYAEALLTGVVSGLITLAGAYLFEDRARRLRAAWARIAG